RPANRRAGPGWPGVLSEPVVDLDMLGGSLLFRARGHLCALPLAHVVETMRPLPVEPMAGAPPYVPGLGISRGRPAPAVDVARLLGEDDARREAVAPLQPSARFVTLKIAGRAI